jgi:hypothetical protein
MKEKFYGVYAALLTPFNEKGEVCEKRLRKLVKFLIFIKKLHHQFLFLSFSITQIRRDNKQKSSIKIQRH